MTANPYRTRDKASTFLMMNSFTADQAREALDTVERNPGRIVTRRGFMLAWEPELPQDGYWIVPAWMVPV